MQKPIIALSNLLLLCVSASLRENSSNSNVFVWHPRQPLKVSIHSPAIILLPSSSTGLNFSPFTCGTDPLAHRQWHHDDCPLASVTHHIYFQTNYHIERSLAQRRRNAEIFWEFILCASSLVKGQLERMRGQSYLAERHYVFTKANACEYSHKLPHSAKFWNSV